MNITYIETNKIAKRLVVSTQTSCCWEDCRLYNRLSLSQGKQMFSLRLGDVRRIPTHTHTRAHTHTHTHTGRPAVKELQLVQCVSPVRPSPVGPHAAARLSADRCCRIPARSAPPPPRPSPNVPTLLLCPAVSTWRTQTRTHAHTHTPTLSIDTRHSGEVAHRPPRYVKLSPTNIPTVCFSAFFIIYYFVILRGVDVVGRLSGCCCVSLRSLYSRFWFISVPRSRATFTPQNHRASTGFVLFLFIYLFFYFVPVFDHLQIQESETLTLKKKKKSMRSIVDLVQREGEKCLEVIGARDS